MNPDTSSSRPAVTRRGPAIMAGLLVLSLVLAAVLAWQAIQTARRHRVTAQRALEDYAQFGAFILASQSYRQLGGAVAEAFTSWPPSSKSIRSGTTCADGSVSFEQVGGAPLKVTGTRLTSAESTFLADTLRNAMSLLEEVGWRFRYIRAPATRFDGFFIGSFRAPSGYGVRGFSACLGGENSPFRRVIEKERALPPALTADLPADSLYSVSVSGAQGRPLYATAIKYVSPYHGSAKLGPEFGDVTLDLQLRPEIAKRLVIGGIPSSPTPLALGLLGLSTLLVVTALLQIRREYELLAIRSDFVSNVSHELRTPLSQILLFADLLKLGRLRSGDERRRSIDIIQQETRRLIRLVENVLQFSRSNAQRPRLELEALPLQGVIEETFDAFRPLAATREVTLIMDVTAQSSVRADRSALRQILLNLLDNAVKYGPRGQTISVDTQGENGRTRIRVSDQGPGIPLDERERVWEGYYRLQREARSAIAGSGIGLAVVRSLAGDMGGSTWVEDADTGGARFVIELPSAAGAVA